MDIDGTYTLQAPVEEVWQCLKDSETLRRAVPGLELLESTGLRRYAFTLHIKQAPLRGVYTGQAGIESGHFPGSPLSCRLTLEGDGQHNPFQGIWDIRLSQQQDNTVVVYSGALNPGKINVLLPLSLVKGAIKILIQQLFANLAEQLRTTTGATYVVPASDLSEEQEGYHNERIGQSGQYGSENGHNELAPYHDRFDVEAALPARTPLHTLVRLIGLGKHDPVLEDLWATRLKRFGTFSVLLLLLWIGSRLPRRLLPRD